MQAENTHSRQKRQRLWYQRDGFLWGLVAALIAAAWGLLPPAGTSLGIGGWLGMGLYMLLAAVPMIVTTMDKRRPQVAGTAPRSVSSACSGWCFTGTPGHSGICSA